MMLYYLFIRGFIWRPDRESNAGLILRRDLFYPLNYRGDRLKLYIKKRDKDNKHILYFLICRLFPNHRNNNIPFSRFNITF